MLDRKQMIVEAHRHIHALLGRHPMDDAFDLAAIRRLAVTRLRIVGADQLDHASFGVLLHLFAGDAVRVAQTHFLARCQAEVLLRRFFAEVIAFDVHGARESNFARACAGIFGIVDRVQPLDMACGDVLDRDLDRIQHRHRARGALVQVVADRILQHDALDGAGCACHTDVVAECAQGFRRVAAPANA